MGKTVAIVDDDPSYSATMKDFLDSQGVSSWRASDGSQFESFARGNAPDLIIIDMQMPGGGGPALVKIIKGQDALKNLPIIFISSMPVDKMQGWFQDISPVRYLSKPPDLTVLTTYLQELLPGWKARP